MTLVTTSGHPRRFDQSGSLAEGILRYKGPKCTTSTIESREVLVYCVAEANGTFACSSGNRDDSGGRRGDLDGPAAPPAGVTG